MAVLVESKRKRSSVKENPALSFIDHIDSPWKGHEQFGFWIVKFLQPKTIVDLGFDKGLSTIVFGYKNRGHVFGIDWFDEGNYAAKCFALDSAFRTISNAIRFKYAKNIHLIVGPFKEISKTWTRQIDILHIDWAHLYTRAKQHYDNWSPYLSENGVVLVHDVLAYPSETGRFFNELPLFKVVFPYSNGLGVASKNKEFIETVAQRFSLELLAV